MAGPRQPIELVIAKGKKNLTKAEISERRATEVQPCMDGIEPPTNDLMADLLKVAKRAAPNLHVQIGG